MTEVQVLFLILAGVYLLQCIGWAPLESEVLRIGWRFRAKTLPHGLPLRFGQYKLFLLNPFSPLAGAIICELFPSVRTRDVGFSADSTPLKTGGVTGARTIRFNWQEKQQIHNKGKEVLSASHVLFFAHSEAYASFLAGVLDRVRKSRHLAHRTEDATRAIRCLPCLPGSISSPVDPARRAHPPPRSPFETAHSMRAHRLLKKHSPAHETGEGRESSRDWEEISPSEVCPGAGNIRQTASTRRRPASIVETYLAGNRPTRSVRNVLSSVRSCETLTTESFGRRL